MILLMTVMSLIALMADVHDILMPVKPVIWISVGCLIVMMTVMSRVSMTS
jgi:hypothetical protein